MSDNTGSPLLVCPGRALAKRLHGAPPSEVDRTASSGPSRNESPYPPRAHRRLPIEPRAVTTTQNSTDPNRRRSFLQALGAAFGVAVIVGNTIGGGILRAPGGVAAQLPSAGWIAAVWIAGGVYALLGANSLAELGAMVPRSGGQYVFVRRALGEYPAFVVGWSDWISSAGSIAAVAIVVGECVCMLVPALAQRETAVASAVVVAFTLLQLGGVRVGDIAQQASSLLKALIYLALVGACFVLTAHFATPTPEPKALPEGKAFAVALIAALQSVLYAYDGWNGVLYFGEEVKNPGRDIPRAMIGGVLAVLAIYLLVNFAMLHVLGLERMAGDPFVAGSAGAALFGAHGDAVIRGLMIAAMLSSVNALVLMTSRVPVALARDRLLPSALASVDARGTPRPAMLLSGAIALAFLASGTFDAVAAVLAFFFVASYVLSFTSVFVLRRREPATPRPYRAFGHPWTTGIVLAGSLVFLVGASYGDWEHSRISLIVLAASLPIFLVVRRLRTVRGSP